MLPLSLSLTSDRYQRSRSLRPSQAGLTAGDPGPLPVQTRYPSRDERTRVPVSRLSGLTLRRQATLKFAHPLCEAAVNDFFGQCREPFLRFCPLQIINVSQNPAGGRRKQGSVKAKCRKILEENGQFSILFIQDLKRKLFDVAVPIDE